MRPDCHFTHKSLVLVPVWPDCDFKYKRLGLHSHLPLHSPAKGKEVKPLKRMANGKAGSFAFAFAIGECGGFAISLKRMANGKWQIKIKMRKTEWDFHPKANATLIYFAEANGKWSLFSLSVI